MCARESNAGGRAGGRTSAARAETERQKLESVVLAEARQEGIFRAEKCVSLSLSHSLSLSLSLSCLSPSIGTHVHPSSGPDGRTDGRVRPPYVVFSLFVFVLALFVRPDSVLSVLASCVLLWWRQSIVTVVQCVRSFGVVSYAFTVIISHIPPK